MPSIEIESSQQQRTIERSYLKIQLDEQTAAVLPMTHVQEALIVPVGRVTSMPNMPACVMGLLNQRSRVLWVVALPQILGLHHLDIDIQNYNIVIIRVGNIPLGLAVWQVKGVVRFGSNLLQSPAGTVTPELLPYIQGCILQSTEVLLVLDSEAIVHAPILKSNSVKF